MLENSLLFTRLLLPVRRCDRWWLVYRCSCWHFFSTVTWLQCSRLRICDQRWAVLLCVAMVPRGDAMMSTSSCQCRSRARPKSTCLHRRTLVTVTGGTFTVGMHQTPARLKPAVCRVGRRIRWSTNVTRRWMLWWRRQEEYGLFVSIVHLIWNMSINNTIPTIWKRFGRDHLNISKY